MGMCLKAHEVDNGVVLNHEDSRELILSWYAFFKNHYPRELGDMTATIKDLDIIPSLALRCGEFYVEDPASDEMRDVYRKMCKKYNTKCISADPSVWHDMGMDEKIRLLITAYCL